MRVTPLLIVLTLLVALTGARAQTLVGFENFTSGDGQYTVASTNNPGGPWSYNPSLTTWSCFDMDPCGAVAFRSSRLNSPVLTVITPGALTLTFQHRWSFEPNDGTIWDGGQVRLSVNGEPYEEVPLTSFIANGYNHVIGGVSTPNNELLGLDVFGDISPGYTTTNFTTSIVNLGSFNVDDTVSIQFIGGWDDCAQGMVPNWEITSVEFSPALEDRKVAPSFPDPTLPADTTVIQGRQAVLTVDVDGIPAPSLQWYRNGNPIFLATNSTLVINVINPTTASGNYFVRASNLAGTNDSRTAVVTAIADTFAPILDSGYILLDNSIVLNFDEPMNPAGFDTFGMALYPTAEGPGSINSVDLASATLTNNTTWIATTLQALMPNVNYTMFIGPGAVTDVYGNANDEINHDLGSEVRIFSIDDNPRWRYDQSGGDFLTSTPPFWDRTFDDSSWPLGAALLGTESSATPEPIRTPVLNTSSGGPITTYYRTRFVLFTPVSSVESLAMQTVIDDGAVAYLNGQEVFRLGVPAGQNYTTLASRSVDNGVLEGPFELDTSALVEGENVLTVELHNVTTSSSDNLWGANLTAIISGIVEEAPVILTQPGPSVIDLDEGESLALTVVASGTPPISYQWNQGGAPILTATNSSYLVNAVLPSNAGVYTVDVSNNLGSELSDAVTVNVTPDLAGPTVVDALAHADGTSITIQFSEPLVEAGATNLANYSVALLAGGTPVNVLGASLAGSTVTLTTDPRTTDNYQLTVRNVTDTAAALNVLAPNPTVLPIDSEVLVLDTDADTFWRYDDTGEPPDADWNLLSYNDAGWSVGAPLFYLKIGTAGILEVPQRTTLTETNASGSTNDLGTERVIAYYFRTSFDFPYDPATTPVSFRYILDDGAAFYLNGSETLRVGMNPTNALTYITLATRTEGNDQSFESAVPVDASPLMQGANLVAAEVHQVTTTSSDLAFGLQILARLQTVSPVLRITSYSVNASGQLILEHNGAALGTPVYIREATDLGGPGVPPNWTTLPGGPHASPYNAGPMTGTRFFQVTDSP